MQYIQTFKNYIFGQPTTNASVVPQPTNEIAQQSTTTTPTVNESNTQTRYVITCHTCNVTINKTNALTFRKHDAFYFCSPQCYNHV